MLIEVIEDCVENTFSFSRYARATIKRLVDSGIDLVTQMVWNNYEHLPDMQD